MGESYDPHGFERQPLDTLAWTPPRFLRRHAERAARRRRLRRFLLAGILGVLGFGYVFAEGGLGSILLRRIRLHFLERQVARLESRREWLHREVELRKTDAATLERLAREEYGMVRPGEKLIRIVEVTEEEAREMEEARSRRLSQQAAAALEEAAARGAGSAHQSGSGDAGPAPAARDASRRRVRP